MSAKDITESLGKLLLECLRTVQIPLIIYLDGICDRFCLLILAGCFLALPDLLRLFRRDQLRDKTLLVFLFLFASEYILLNIAMSTAPSTSAVSGQGPLSHKFRH